MMKKIFLLIVTVCYSTILFCQEETKDFNAIGIKQLSFGYGIEVPFGDLSDRYGRNLKFTIGGERVTPKNWIYGLEFSFMFGDNVKEDVLSYLQLDNGEILGADNAYADFFYRQRGMFLGANLGKIFPFSKNSRSGLRVTNAIGVLQHNVRIADDASSLPQIENDYAKGYDRMTRGLALRQFVGYHHISNDRRINFYIGLEFTQAFTKEIRLLNFDTGLPSNPNTRFDGLVGLKAAWILPFFDAYEDAEIFY